MPEIATVSLAAQVLAVKALLKTPKQWSKGELAVDRDGKVADFHDDDACSFCLIGAIARVSDDLKLKAYPFDPYSTVEKSDLGKLVAAVLVGRERVYKSDRITDRFAKFNDSMLTTHGDVLAALDVAYIHAKQSGL